jgi:multisubunit Na+/H+ antiporter MnhG subunit
MKLKSIPMILTLLLFIIGMYEFMMIFMKLELLTTMLTISTALLFIGSMSAFVRTAKPTKLAYPLIIIYFFVGMPIIGKFIHNTVLYMGFAVLSFVITIIFLYNDLIEELK